jgi:hypothetical protein
MADQQQEALQQQQQQRQQLEEVQVSWNDALEKVIASEGERASGLAWLHTECELHYSKLTTYIALPVICLSAINGFVSGASSLIFGDNTNVSSLGVGGVSLLTALLSTVGSYFAWAKRTEGHRIGSIQYLKLSKFINMEMALSRRERIRAKDMLKMVREQSERLMEISPAIPTKFKVLYNSKFHDIQGISHPEVTNGIQKVSIYKENEIVPEPPKPQERVRITFLE